MRIEDAADLRVGISDRSIVASQLAGERLTRPRPRERGFVTQDHVAVVERMEWQEVHGERELARSVKGVELGRRGLRIVGRVEFDVQKERPPTGVARE